MACCNHWVKALLLVINFLFAVSGIAIITIGALFYTKFQPYTRFLESQVMSPPIILIIVGSIVFIISFLGCCGAMTESTCMLALYAVLLAVILVAEISLGVYVLVAPAKSEEAFNKALRKEYDLTSTDQAAYQMVYTLQTELHCCGVNDYTDWLTANNWDQRLKTSCCPKSEVSLPCNQLMYYTKGCAKAITDFVADKAAIIGGVGVGLAVIEIAGIINAVALRSYIKNKL